MAENTKNLKEEELRNLEALIEKSAGNRREFAKKMFSAENPKIKIRKGKVAGIWSGQKFYKAPVVVNATGSWAGKSQGLGPAAPVKPGKLHGRADEK